MREAGVGVAPQQVHEVGPSGEQGSVDALVAGELADPRRHQRDGGAKLSVVLLDPAYDILTGATTYPQGVGDHVANVRGYRTLRDVVYGGTFEGYTTVGIGVRARLPYRVFVLAGPGAGSRIVIDVAHRWSA